MKKFSFVFLVFLFYSKIQRGITKFPSIQDEQKQISGNYKNWNFYKGSYKHKKSPTQDLVPLAYFYLRQSEMVHWLCHSRIRRTLWRLKIWCFNWPQKSTWMSNRSKHAAKVRWILQRLNICTGYGKRSGFAIRLYIRQSFK